MSTSEARIIANRRNAELSTGPKTPEGKARSRANSLKHGLTGAGIVLPNEDAAEVELRLASFEEELKPTGELGRSLVRRAVVLSVRMDRSVEQETAALAEIVRRAEADFEPPEGLDAQTVALLRADAGRRAMFDPSKEATLARRYEAAAERGFFRCLKELRLLQRDAKATAPAVDAEILRKTMGLFLQADKPAVRAQAKSPEPAPMTASRPSKRFEQGSFTPIESIFDVPITIGRPR